MCTYSVFPLNKDFAPVFESKMSGKDRKTSLTRLNCFFDLTTNKYDYDFGSNFITSFLSVHP